ncbi:MAG TPA: hypothetical protein VFG20_21415 [Planctomycetaceae bacterium]|nr:hypothetical protein [Planctomycetaceae bacterium]
MPAPRVWFHLIISAYGSWLPGDPRGFRTRHHRDHVDGDYKSPPPVGIYDELHDANQQSLTQPATVIPTTLRPIVGSALRDRFNEAGGRVLAISCGGQHAHIQVQLDAGDARVPLRNAKRTATYAARNAGFEPKLWAIRGKIIRIRDRAHQQNVYRYILDHAHEGAWVWSALWKQNEETHG